jgi:hypothetical protein
MLQFEELRRKTTEAKRNKLMEDKKEYKKKLRH